MSVSIRYKGRIATPARIKGLHRDLIRFADRVKWECLDLGGAGESEILETILYPPGRWEPVYFLVDCEGRLHPPYEADSEHVNDSTWCSVKTQYSPIEEHVQLVQLLRHIRRHYIPDLEVSDEGTYWETRDLESLRSARELLTNQMVLLTEELSSIEEDAPADPHPPYPNFDK